MRAILGWATLAMIGATQADAAYTVTIRQSGNDVVATGTGTLAISQLIYAGPGIANTPNLVASSSLILTGAGTPTNAPTSAYLAFFTPTSGFGGNAFSSGTNGTGDNVGMEPSALFLFVPVGYSGGQLSSTTTFANTSLSGLGLFSGTFAYGYAATQGGPAVDTFTVRIDFGSTAVPEPASALMLGLGVIGPGIVARGRQRR